jgi:hypothetical protein
MHFSSISILFFSGIAVALPKPEPCKSNWWEKIHEGHWHDINSGSWFGLPIHLVFPGGTGCYKGTRTTAAPETDEEPDLSKLPSGMSASWMPGYDEASKKWASSKKKPAQPSTAQTPSYNPNQPYSPTPNQPYGPAPNQQQSAPQLAIPQGMHLQLEPNDLESAKQWNSPEVQQFQPGMTVPNGWHLELVGVVPNAPPPSTPNQQNDVVQSSGWHVQQIPSLSA